ncbi:cAMP-binding protein [Xenococcus sp. PCC 7305]|uniref:Crp/Fnr family transcriptional regulator n=1 Tax=Xenococcus sp. PCC 7305 TaxID=102125 RepID=UPI0002ACBE7A|nr:Crp/Fnr family transcriptional regulator [Xenococcus sp. PCC 7305]ELS01007.1 cAMP-binding protein [Xenococcus sp. PCC 7305]
MQFSDNSPEASRPFLIWQKITEWGQTHYRDRLFRKDELIPIRSGLLYLVTQGAVRLVGTNQSPIIDEDELISHGAESDSDFPQDNFLGFVSAGKPFEIAAQSDFKVQAYAHWDDTHVIWLYWQDLENWTNFRQEVYESLRSQNQYRSLLLMALGQRKTIDRLLSFLKVIIKEHGQLGEDGYYLPYLLTHAQIGSIIGATRVTVTRLMGKLRRQGLILIRNDSLICLPHPQSDR